MGKFTFLTLVIILGMSLVSFGKSYLCIPERGVFFLPDDTWLIKKKAVFDKNKFIVKTEGNNRKMISVKPFGADYYTCKVGEVIFEKGHGVLSGVGESIKGGDFITCRQPHTSSNGGFTKDEFILDFKKRKFHWYSMLEFRRGQTFSGKCEEI